MNTKPDTAAAATTATNNTASISEDGTWLLYPLALLSAPPAGAYRCEVVIDYYWLVDDQNRARFWIGMPGRTGQHHSDGPFSPQANRLEAVSRAIGSRPAYSWARPDPVLVPHAWLPTREVALRMVAPKGR